MAGEWTIPRSKLYSGPAGRGLPGPTLRVQEAAPSSNDDLQLLAFLFPFFIPWVLLEKIARESNSNAFHDWVYEEADAMDCDGNVKTNKVLLSCDTTHPRACHRISQSCTTEKWEFAAAFILSFIAVVLQYGAHGTDCLVTNFWRSKTYGIRAPWVTNSITRKAFCNAQQYIQFVNNNAN